jgi:hypothetical protein
MATLTVVVWIIAILLALYVADRGFVNIGACVLRISKCKTEP